MYLLKINQPYCMDDLNLVTWSSTRLAQQCRLRQVEAYPSWLDPFG